MLSFVSKTILTRTIVSTNQNETTIISRKRSVTVIDKSDYQPQIQAIIDDGSEEGGKWKESYENSISELEAG